MKIFSASARNYLASGAHVSQQLSYKINELDRVRWVIPDSFLNVKSKTCGGEPFIDGQAVPYDSKFLEEGGRNNNRPNERNFNWSKNSERRELQINRGRITRGASNTGVQQNRGAPHVGSAPNIEAVSPTVSVPPYNTSGFQKRGGLHPSKLSTLPEMLPMPSDNMPGPPNIGTMAYNYMKDIKQSRDSRISRHGWIHDTDCRRLSTAAVSSNSYPILQSNSLQHWFKNWQEQRRNKLTASTFSAAIGFWHKAKRREQLWEEKIGVREPFSGNLATCWNNIKEREALESYMLITGNSVSLTGFQVYKNPEDDWLGASPDGVLDKFYGLPYGGILEIKCPYFNGDMSTATPLKRLPVHYIPQAQGLMEILDREWMDLYVWTTKGSSLFRLYRKEEYWRLINTALSDFWWKHVQPARWLCIESVISNHAEQLASFRPAPKHKLFGTIIRESKQIAIDSELIMREFHGKL